MRIHNILYPTTFPPVDEIAFVHALKLVLSVEGALSILHLDPIGSLEEHFHYPDIRRTLVKWGILKENGEYGDDQPSKFQVCTSVVKDKSPMHALANHLACHKADLMVLTTRKQSGLGRLHSPSLSNLAAGKTVAMTLFLPEGARGFVESEKGGFKLNHILVPVDHDPPSGQALKAVKFLQRFGDPNSIKITLLHVSDGTRPFPDNHPYPENWKRDIVAKTKSGSEHIVEFARNNEVDCIAMATAGRHGLFDAIMGSTTEQVLRHAPCPVLAVNAFLAEQL